MGFKQLLNGIEYLSNKDLKKKEKIESAKSMFAAGMSLLEIAESLDLSLRTVQKYKAEAGGDWDKLREVERLCDSQKKAGTIYGEFSEQLKSAIAQVLESEKLTALEKTGALAKLADSFVKVRAASRQEDPEKYRLAIIKNTLRKVLAELQTKLKPETLSQVIEILENKNFQKRLADLNL